MIYFASQLAYLASIANFGTIISVILIFTAMVIFIRQFRYERIAAILKTILIIFNTGYMKLIHTIHLCIIIRGKLEK